MGLEVLFPKANSALAKVSYRPSQAPETVIGPDRQLRYIISAIFGWDQEVRGLIYEEYLQKRLGTSMRVILAKWLGESVEEDLAFIARSSSISTSDWMLLALNVGITQKQTHMVFAKRLIEQGDLHAAAAVMIGFGAFDAAIDLYASRKLWVEAVLLTALRLPSDIGRIVSLVRSWGECEVAIGNAELAVRCFHCILPSMPTSTRSPSHGQELAQGSPAYSDSTRRTTGSPPQLSSVPAQKVSISDRRAISRSRLGVVTKFDDAEDRTPVSFRPGQRRVPSRRKEDFTPIEADLITPLKSASSYRSLASGGTLSQRELVSSSSESELAAALERDVYGRGRSKNSSRSKQTSVSGRRHRDKAVDVHERPTPSTPTPTPKSSRRHASVWSAADGSESSRRHTDAVSPTSRKKGSSQSESWIVSNARSQSQRLRLDPNAGEIPASSQVESRSDGLLPATRYDPRTIKSHKAARTQGRETYGSPLPKQTVDPYAMEEFAAIGLEEISSTESQGGRDRRARKKQDPPTEKEVAGQELEGLRRPSRLGYSYQFSPFSVAESDRTSIASSADEDLREELFKTTGFSAVSSGPNHRSNSRISRDHRADDVAPTPKTRQPVMSFATPKAMEFHRDVRGAAPKPKESYF